MDAAADAAAQRDARLAGLPSALRALLGRRTRPNWVTKEHLAVGATQALRSSAWSCGDRSCCAYSVGEGCRKEMRICREEIIEFPIENQKGIQPN